MQPAPEPMWPAGEASEVFGCWCQFWPVAVRPLWGPGCLCCQQFFLNGKLPWFYFLSGILFIMKRLLFHWIVPAYCLHNVCFVAKCPSIGNKLFLHHQFVSMDEEEGSCHITRWCHWSALIEQSALEWVYGFISICMASSCTHLNLQGHSLGAKAAGLLSIFYLQSWVVTPYLRS